MARATGGYGPAVDDDPIATILTCRESKCLPSNVGADI